MAFSLNKIMLIGNLGRDAETRFTTNNVSVTNFSEWAWRPNLKVFNHKNNEWLPYEGNIYAYTDAKDKPVWTGDESNTGEDEFDNIQRWHEHNYYFQHSESSTDDTCTVVFKLTKEKDAASVFLRERLWQIAGSIHRERR